MLALKFLWAPDPVAISLGSISIYYYSLMFVIAFTFGLYLMKYMYKKEGVSATYLDPLLLYMVVGTLLGARLGEVFFYNWDYFQNNLLEIILPFKISGNLKIDPRNNFNTNIKFNSRFFKERTGKTGLLVYVFQAGIAY